MNERCRELGMEVLTLRHRQHNNPLINHQMEDEPVLLNMWMNPFSSNVPISLPNSFCLFPQHNSHIWKLWIDYKTCIKLFANFSTISLCLPTHHWHQMMVVIATGSQATTGLLEDKYISAYRISQIYIFCVCKPVQTPPERDQTVTQQSNTHVC